MTSGRISCGPARVVDSVAASPAVTAIGRWQRHIAIHIGIDVPERLPMPPRTLTIEQTYFVAAPVRKVFWAISDPEGLAQWFLAKARLPPKKGAEYWFEWRGGYAHGSKVLDYVKGRRLALSWPNTFRGVTTQTRLVIRLRKSGRGTLISIRHSGYPRTPGWVEIYGGTQAGWAYYLMNLKSVLETGRDLRSPKDA